jgi:malate synthase
MNRIILVTGLAMLVVLTGCKTGNTEDENIQKLLQNQAQMEQAQEQSVEKLAEIRDSLNVQRRTLLDERDSTDRQILHSTPSWIQWKGISAFI